MANKHMNRYSTSSVQIQMTMSYHNPFRKAKVKRKYLVLVRMTGNGNFKHSWLGCKLVQPCKKDIWPQIVS